MSIKAPLQKAQPTGAKFPPNILISPINGLDMFFCSCLKTVSCFKFRVSSSRDVASYVSTRSFLLLRRYRESAAGRLRRNVAIGGGDGNGVSSRRRLEAITTTEPLCGATP